MNFSDIPPRTHMKRFLHIDRWMIRGSTATSRNRLGNGTANVYALKHTTSTFTGQHSIELQHVDLISFHQYSHRTCLDEQRTPIAHGEKMCLFCVICCTEYLVLRTTYRLNTDSLCHRPAPSHVTRSRV